MHTATLCLQKQHAHWDLSIHSGTACMFGFLFAIQLYTLQEQRVVVLGRDQYPDQQCICHGFLWNQEAQNLSLVVLSSTSPT